MSVKSFASVTRSSVSKPLLRRADTNTYVMMRLNLYSRKRTSVLAFFCCVNHVTIVDEGFHEATIMLLQQSADSMGKGNAFGV